MLLTLVCQINQANAEKSVGYAAISVGFAENSIGFAENSPLPNPTLTSAFSIGVLDAKSSSHQR